MSENRILLQEIVGKGYADFWNSRKRYRVVKGSRASKKSTTTALNIIVRMMQYPLSNCLVVRKTLSTLKDSCYAQLKWAISRLGVENFWKSTVNPLQITYLPTGQKILFRGLDDSLKVTSITVEKGVLNFAWLEEAFEVDEDEFNRVDESLRGELPEGYFISWAITFNPWSSSSWLKSRFFDTPKSNVLAMTTTYKCNEWLSDADRELFEDMRLNDPQRYLVAGLGQWGLDGGQFFTQFNEQNHVVKPFEIPAGWSKFRSADWGAAKPYCILWWAVDFDGNLYCYRELYGWGGKPNVGTGETAKQVAQKIIKVESRAENVRVGYLDSACFANFGSSAPTIGEEMNDELRKAKLTLFSKSAKGRIAGADALKQRLIGNKIDGKFKPAIYFFSSCIHTIRTLPLLSHDKREPEKYDTEGEDHAVDAIVYACLSRPWTPLKPSTEKVKHDGYKIEEKRSAWTY